MTAVAVSYGASDDSDTDIVVNHRLSSIMEEDYPQHLQPEERHSRRVESGDLGGIVEWRRACRVANDVPPLFYYELD